MKRTVLKITYLSVLMLCLALSFSIACYAQPEFSPDGKTCIVPGCHQEGEVQETIYDVDPAVIAANAPKISDIEGAEDFSDSEKGMKGDVTVTMAIVDGQIKDVVIYGPYETQGVGSNAVEQMPQQILDAQDWDVDGVSGATYTSNAVRQAAKACLMDAGLYEEPAAPEHTPVKGAEYFTASAKGFGGDIEVSIGVLDGKIVDVTISGPEETVGVGSNAVEQMPQQILDAQDWNVDGYSGATFSSTAIREAAKAAIDEAGLLNASESTPESEAAVTEMPAEATATEQPISAISIIAAVCGAVTLVAILTSAFVKKKNHKG